MSSNNLSDNEILRKLNEQIVAKTFSQFISKALFLIKEADEARANEQLEAAKSNNLILRHSSDLSFFIHLVKKFEKLMFKDKQLISPQDRPLSHEVELSEMLNRPIDIVTEKGINSRIKEHIYRDLKIIFG